MDFPYRHKGLQRIIRNTLGVSLFYCGVDFSLDTTLSNTLLDNVLVSFGSLSYFYQQAKAKKYSQVISMFKESETFEYLKVDSNSNPLEVSKGVLDAIGKNDMQEMGPITHWYKNPEDQDRVKSILESGKILSDMTITFLKENGDEIHTNVLLGFVDDSGHANIFVKNITESVLENEKLKKELEYDSLTNVLRKDAFMGRVGEIVKNNNQGYLLFIDFDDFKCINENYGHLGGDFALVSMTEKIQEPLSSIPGSLLGRYGGDEFVAYIPSVSKDEVTEVLLHMTNPLIFNYESKGERKLTMSVGAKKYTSTKTLEDNLKDANSILFDVKGVSKGMFFFYDDF